MVRNENGFYGILLVLIYTVVLDSIVIENQMQVKIVSAKFNER